MRVCLDWGRVDKVAELSALKALTILVKTLVGNAANSGSVRSNIEPIFLTLHPF